MAEFAWRAIDARGTTRSGWIRAGSAADASKRLTAQGHYLLALDAAPERAALFSATPRLSTAELGLFTRQLATLAGVCPLAEALDLIARQTEKPRARRIIALVQSGVGEGQPLAVAMARAPRSFDPLYCAMVAAGDGAGTLTAVLDRLALLLERRAALRNRVITALAYPAVLALVALFVVAALMIFVVPKMVAQFDQVGQTLPLLTRIVIGLSNLMSGYWPVLLALLIAAGLLLMRAWRAPASRLRIDRGFLRLPLVGRMIRDLHSAMLARNLATMIAARLPILEGLDLARLTIANHALRGGFDTIIAEVRGGASLSQALESTGLFPPLLVYLAASGEASGQLDQMLERAADYLEREFDGVTATALALLEPLVIVAMGVIVALIVLSVLLPILQLERLAAL